MSTKRRLGAALVTVCSITGLCPLPVGALGPSDGGTSSGGSADRSVTVTVPGHGPGEPGPGAGPATGATGGTPHCSSILARSARVVGGPLGYASSVIPTAEYPPDPTGRFLWVITHCVYPDGQRTNSIGRFDTVTSTGSPATSPSPGFRATAHLHLDFPTLHFSPARDQTVGFPTWIWLAADAWHTLQAADTDGALHVTLTATPSDLVFDPGDGSAPVHCRGPGTPYRAGIDRGWDASPDCGHVYTTSSRRRPGGHVVTTTTMVWTFNWHASDGTSGTLPALRITRHDELTVHAYTAVTD